ncbi:MAG: hypothetical protein ACR652_14430 [Methylocystis sp.]|uniref:hypothetical protein n=1 Tax=Methylocystis sp. TaxID=1911079 RepID=UPI003DA39DA6
MSGSASPGATSGRAALALTLLGALALACALAAPRVGTVWRTGAFFDPDDALRAVELRDFLAGQGWFDVTATRLDPPSGLPMHWSRIVDVALAALRAPFLSVFAPDQAERAMRLAFPLALLAMLLALSGWVAACPGGARTRLLAIWLVTLSGPMFGQFAPGRIDHHAPQIVTLMAAFGCLSQGLNPARAAWLAACAALMALSMGISLENLPFFAPMAGALAWLFLADGARAPLAWFAAGALLAFPLVFAATVAPAAWAVAACDANSAPWLAAIVTAALGLVALALAAPRLTRMRGRAIGVGATIAASLAVFAGLAPRCLGGPFADLDPLLRELWLAHVTEVMPLSQLAARSPAEAAVLAAPVTLGLVAALWRAHASAGLQRRRFGLAAATIAIGLCAGALHIRVLSSVTPLAMVALAEAIAFLSGGLRASPALRNACAGALAFFLSPIGLALTLAGDGRDARKGDAACLTPEALAPLAAQPEGRVLGPFSLGSYILAHTPHAAFAAPYHRNNHGNLVAANVFLAAPEQAEALARRAGATLIVWCARGAEPSPLATAAPAGLAATLARGETPPWLERRSTADVPLLVFAVRSVE